MGAKAAGKRRFLSAHPLCCFCGGSAPATTEDHVPPRAMFRRRQWPEGYVFPACQSCNSATRFTEQVMAMVSRVSVATSDDLHDSEIRQALDGVRNNNPVLFREMRPSANDVRRFLRRRGLPIPAGKTTADIPLIKLSGPIATASLREFARKLFCALHYRETGRIIPRAGAIRYWWWSNVQAADGKIPTEIPPMMTGYRTLRRANRALNEQFAYRFEISEDGSLGMYMARFNTAFAITGMVAFDEALLIDAVEDKTAILKPFTGAP